MCVYGASRSEYSVESLSCQGMLSEPRDLGRELTTELHGRGRIVVAPKCGLCADLPLIG